MKLKSLLWIVAAVAVVAVGIFIFTSKRDETAQEPTEVIESAEAVAEAEAARIAAEEEKKQQEAERLAAEEKAAAEAEAARLAEQEKAKRKANARRLAQKKAAEAKAKAEAEKRAAEEAAKAKAEAERLAAEKAKAEAERAAKAKAEAERLAKEEKARKEHEAAVAIFNKNGLKGRVISRHTREAVGNTEIAIVGTAYKAKTNSEGYFELKGVPAGSYKVSFNAPEHETLDIMVKVEQGVKNINSVIVVPEMIMNEGIDEAVFNDYDIDGSTSEVQVLPTSLSSYKDLYSNIASYRFSEMRFNARGYDSKLQNINLNGIRFNDALTGYGPWSLWSGMNDATRNQEHYSGLAPTDYGLGGVAGATYINARASQMRKGFRASVSTGNQMYRFRAIVSYASGLLDNGWSYAFSVSTRQGGNGYVDGVYYNSYGYFAAAEKQFGDKHRLSLMVLGTPQQRGAQQASTQEAYDLFGSNYYNPNVGFQDGKLRNSRVRRSHEPIVMLNYYYDISEKTRLTAATSVRFGFNGYSALTWKDGADPRPDYYRYLPSNYTSQIFSDNYGLYVSQNMNSLAQDGLLKEALTALRTNRVKATVPGIFTHATPDEQIGNYLQAAADARSVWTGRMDFDGMINANRNGKSSPYANGHRSNYIIEERHTDQIDYNFVANISHIFNQNNKILGGVKARINRTEYYDKIKDLLGGDFWIDVDKFAERDMGSDPEMYQNDLDYYNEHGHARVVREGDKFSYDYYAHVRQAQLWGLYEYKAGGFKMNLGAEIGYAGLWREGLMRKGLFAHNSKGDSEHLNFLTYKAKAAFSYRINKDHQLELNLGAIQEAPTFNSAFVSPRTRNTVTPGLSPEKAYSAELTYNLNLPNIQARITGYYTEMLDQSKVISFYDDTQSSFTNFAMSNIDKRHYGVEFAVRVPIWNGLAFQGALNYGDYRYTSNPNFVQTVDNSNKIKLEDTVNWKGFYVESTPQFAVNVGLDFRGPKNWFASINFNYYDKLYLSMNPAYRTNNAIEPYRYAFNNTNDNNVKLWALKSMSAVRAQEDLGNAFTLAASLGKNWYIQRKYTIGFSAEVKNILNNKGIRTGGYEQMRLYKTRGYAPGQENPSTTYYTRFDSKYFYMLGTTVFLNVYFRF